MSDMRLHVAAANSYFYSISPPIRHQ
jgi:hypothetical protein